MLPRAAAKAADLALEATVAGSFTSVGYRVRSTLGKWPPLSSYDLAGRSVLVTGATSGLGAASAASFVELGAQVLVLGRDPDRTAAAAQRLGAEPVIADLADLGAVRRAAEQIRALLPDGLDVLVHNAGALTADYTETVDGLELTYATHVVAPFLLTHELLPALRARPGSRVITVSSGGMYTQALPDAVAERAQDYDGVRAYAKAKRAQVVLNAQWAARHPEVVFQAMHPGWADTPGVVTSLPTFHRVVGPLLRTPQEGADTIVWLAAASEALTGSGRFWLDRTPRSVVRLPGTATTPERAAALWDAVARDAGVLTFT